MDALEQISLPPTLNPASTRALLAELEMAISNPGAKVIVIAGGDGVFCRGLDLAVIATGGNNSEPRPPFVISRAVLELLGAAPKPTIA